MLGYKIDWVSNMSFTESPQVREHGVFKEIEQRFYAAARFLLKTPEAPDYMSDHYRPKVPGEVGGVAVRSVYYPSGQLQLIFEESLEGYSEIADSLLE